MTFCFRCACSARSSHSDHRHRRGKLLAALERALRDGQLLVADEGQQRTFQRRLKRLRGKSWVVCIVYAKRPFGGPEQVHRHLGRYTHRVAISNARLLAANADGVTFRTRGENTATLAPVDFLRRFLDHTLPAHFVKIRHYGLLASGNVTTRLARARALLTPAETAHSEEDHGQGDDIVDAPALILELLGVDVRTCPRCNEPALRRMPLPPLRAARAPPQKVAAA